MAVSLRSFDTLARRRVCGLTTLVLRRGITFQQRRSFSASSLNFVKTSQKLKSAARLTPQEVSNILRQNEFSMDEIGPEGSGPVRSFDSNSLRSNNPSEDSHSEAIMRIGSKFDNAMLFGVFDGHGGAACGQVVAKRLLHYIAAGLLSFEDLKQHLIALDAQAEGRNQDVEFLNLLQTINDPFELVSDLQRLYQESYREYVQLLKEKRLQEAENDIGSSVEERLIHAFKSLDDAMSNEALNPPAWALGENAGDSDAHMKTLTVALSGAVAAVAHVDGNMMHIASTGDCTVVLGTLSENDTWIATKLTKEHASGNQEEVKRILSEHPGENPKDIIKGDRLMGILAPLRAFGDFKFKWPAETIESVLGTVLNRTASSKVKMPPAVPPNYKSPPYLTACPEVTSHKLTARDKFIIIGSDGLWDMMTPMQVIRLVGEHMSGKITLTPLNVDSTGRNLCLSKINTMLRMRQAAMKLKPIDSNASTHLIRSALGGSSYGVDHGKLSQMLSLPQDMVRMFRDDMTVTVVFFDSEFLRHS